jgi:hypothetical protein
MFQTWFCTLDKHVTTRSGRPPSLFKLIKKEKRKVKDKHTIRTCKAPPSTPMLSRQATITRVHIVIPNGRKKISVRYSEIPKFSQAKLYESLCASEFDPAQKANFCLGLMFVGWQPFHHSNFFVFICV